MVFNIICPDLFFTKKCNLRCKYCFETHSNNTVTYEKLREFVESKSFIGFFPFGGEPLMALDILCELLDNTTGKRNEQIRSIITNGTLIKKNIDIIKKYKMSCQISIDGSKHVNDINRIYINGRGSYDDIMEGIECCISNNIGWSIHGVVNKKTLPYLAEIYQWFYKTYRKGYEVNYVINTMAHNITEVIFEEDYDDNDIDIYCEQIEKIFEWIRDIEELTNEQKKKLMLNIINHVGGTCGAGITLLAIDDKLDIYPCHRLATVVEREKYKLGNIYDVEHMDNFKVYNSFIRIAKTKKMFSAGKNIRGYKDRENTRLLYWCPSTNLQTSGSVYYQNSKYNIMLVEVNRKIKECLIEYGYSKQSNNRN